LRSLHKMLCQMLRQRSLLISVSLTVADRRMGVHRWQNVLLGALIASCGVAAIEWVARSAGYRPAVHDSRELWHLWRQRIPAGDPRVVVLLGTSRMQSDVSIATMESCLPGHLVVQLAVEGPSSSVGIFEGLANDPSFCGVVICELETPLLERSRWSDLHSYWAYDPPSLPRYWDGIARNWIGDKLVAMQPAFTLRSCFARLAGDLSVPGRGHVSMRFSRETQLDFGRLSDREDYRRRAAEQFRARYEGNPIARFESVQQEIKSVDDLARGLESRGGRAVFIRMPSFGDHWRIEEEFHPKANWDRFASMTQATCIHFRDVAEMRGLNSPDESHLDFRDAPRFTRALVRELRLRGVVQ
jgi:hypothetical protein